MKDLQRYVLAERDDAKRLKAGLLAGRFARALGARAHECKLADFLEDRHHKVENLLLDMQDHPVTVDVGDLEPQRLAESQPGGVARGEDHAVLGTGHAVEKPNDLLRAQDDRQRVAALRHRQGLDRPVPLERDLIEETQSRHGARHRGRRELAVIEQVQLVGPDVLGTEQLGRLPVVASELRDLRRLQKDASIAASKELRAQGPPARGLLEGRRLGAKCVAVGFQGVCHTG